MSIKQMTKVFNDETLKGNEKLLMLAIADNANDTGVCFPSWSELIKKTSMSKGSISKWFIVLEDKGLLFRKSRNRKNGSRTSNKFLIYPHKNKENLDEEDMLIFEDLFIQSSKAEPSAIVRELNYHSSEIELPKGGQSSEVEHLEPSLIINHQLNRHSKDELFEMFWKEYPRKISKVNAKKAFMKHFDKLPDIQELLSIVKMQSFSDNWSKDNGKFIPHPATWINGNRWEDEVNLTDYEKMKAINAHTGMSALDFLKQQGYA